MSYIILQTNPHLIRRSTKYWKEQGTDCPEILPIALGLVHLIVMAFALASYIETSFIVKWIISGRGAALHRSNLMTPLERILVRAMPDWKWPPLAELVELEDGPQVRGMKCAINSSTFDNVYLIWLSCVSWRSAKRQPRLFRASCCESDILRSSC